MHPISLQRIISECMQRQRQVVDEINDYALGASGVFDLSQERFEGTHVAYKVCLPLIAKMSTPTRAICDVIWCLDLSPSYGKVQARA